jgi:acyl-CoA synthetase (NDP forming)
MSNNRTSFEDYLNASYDEVSKAKTSETETYVFNNEAKTVLAEYTFKGKKYVVTDSKDQEGKSTTEIFIVGEGNSLSIPEKDDPYYEILKSIKNSQFPNDVVMESEDKDEREF